MSLIREKLVELCDTISSDEKFVRYQKIVDEFINDNDVNSDYQELLELQKELNIKKLEEKLTSDDVDYFDAECARVFAQPKVSEFLEAQDALDQLLDMVNRYVELTFEFGKTPTEEEVAEEEKAEEEIEAEVSHGSACSCCS